MVFNPGRLTTDQTLSYRRADCRAYTVAFWIQQFHDSLLFQYLVPQGSFSVSCSRYPSVWWHEQLLASKVWPYAILLSIFQVLCALQSTCRQQIPVKVNVQWSRLLPVLPFRENGGGNRMQQLETPFSTSFPLPHLILHFWSGLVQLWAAKLRYNSLLSILGLSQIWHQLTFHKPPYFSGPYRTDFQRGSQLPYLVLQLTGNCLRLIAFPLPNWFIQKSVAM